MQQRFVKITNKLHGLGKPITNQVTWLSVSLRGHGYD
jgi:hypothetical protein